MMAVAGFKAAHGLWTDDDAGIVSRDSDSAFHEKKEAWLDSRTDNQLLLLRTSCKPYMQFPLDYTVVTTE